MPKKHTSSFYANFFVLNLILRSKFDPSCTYKYGRFLQFVIQNSLV